MAFDSAPPLCAFQASQTCDMLQKDAKLLNARWECIRPKPARLDRDQGVETKILGV
jgi:hypothetical protein